MTIDLEHFRRRVIQDALADGEAGYWLRRAATFEWARPRPGDYQGQATDEEYAALDRELAETAEACRARARACKMAAVA